MSTDTNAVTQVGRINIEEIKTQRKTIRTKITLKATSARNQTLPKDDSALQSIRKLISDLDQINEQFFELGGEICEEDVRRYGDDCRFLLQYFETSNEIPAYQQPLVNYQKRPLPTFSGDIFEFNTFIDEFDSLVKHLSPRDQFFYLKASLTGRPLNLIKTLPAGPESYTMAREVLVEEYQDKTRIKMEIISKINNISRADTRNIEKTRDTLSNMEELFWVAKYHQLDSNFIDYELKKQFTLLWFPGTDRQFRNTTTCEQFLQSAKIELNSMIDVHGQTTTLVPKRVNQTIRKKCVFCEKDHPSIFCDSNMTNMARREIAIKEKLCFRCLRKSHLTNECRSKYLCKSCKQPHSAVICVPSTSVKTVHQAADQKNDDSDLVA